MFRKQTLHCVEQGLKTRHDLLNLQLLKSECGHASVEEDRDEDNDECSGEEQLSHFRCRVSDGQGKGNSTTKAYTGENTQKVNYCWPRIKVHTKAKTASHNRF